MKKKKLTLFLSIICSIALILATIFTVLWQENYFQVTATLSQSSNHYEYNELIENSCLIVRGKVIGSSDPICITPTGGGDDSLFTDHYLEITHILRGEASVGAVVNVRTQGGETHALKVVCEFSPTIQQGDEVVAFLYRHNVGGGYTTDEDYYRITGTDQGWYILDTSAENEIFKSTIGYPDLNWSEISVDIPIYSNEHPINYNWMRDRAIASIQRDLDNGNLTQQEYEQEMANLDIYATVKH